MKNKTFFLVGLSILVFLFLMSFVSPMITLTATDTVFSQANGDTLSVGVVGITAGNTVTFSFSPVNKDYTGKEITFTTFPTLPLTTDGTIVITSNVPSGFVFFGEEHTTTLTATEKDALGVIISSATQTLTFTETTFCEWGGNCNKTGDLTVQIKEIKVVKGFGEDEEWYPFDEVEVEIRVKNSLNKDIDDIVLEWGLFNKKTGKWTIAVDDEKDFNLKDGESKTLILKFKIEDLDEDFEDLNTQNFVFYVRATGDIEDGETTCTSASKDVKIITDDEFVIVDNIKIAETASCGSEVYISADVWNIGEDEEDAVVVNIYGSELGLNKDVEIGDIGSFDSEPLEFSFTVPKGLDEKSYTIKLTVYDEDDKVYTNENDDDSIFIATLKVEGNCAVAEASVTAVLESGGKAGKQMVVRATVTNTGDKITTYVLNTAGYSEWASLASLDKTSITLDVGKSEDVLITLDVNKDALGEKLFTLEVLSENKLILSQPISVEIIKRGLFGITGNVFSGDNKYLWAIGLANVVLIVLIIVIAIRISKK